MNNQILNIYLEKTGYAREIYVNKIINMKFIFKIKKLFKYDYQLYSYRIWFFFKLNPA